MTPLPPGTGRELRVAPKHLRAFSNSAQGPDPLPPPLPGDGAGGRPAAVGGEQIVHKKACQSPSCSAEQDLLRVYTPFA